MDLSAETAHHDQMPTGDGLAARRAAYAILNAIMFKNRTLDEASAAAPGIDGMASRDKAFVRLLVSLVLKRAAELDAVLGQLLNDPISELKPPQLVNIFRLGIAQFAYLQTPPHAAVNTTVELAEAEGIAHHKPLVNAIMRRLTREGVEMPDIRDAGRMNTPAWLWDEWMGDYGVETALDIAAANLNEAPVDFFTKSNPKQWAATLEAELLPTGGLRRKTTGFIPDLPGFTQGTWWIQSAAASIPAQMFGDLSSKTVVDLCAAPGGKTAQLASMGAHVIAVDRSAARVKRLEENIERLNLNVETVVSDGAVWLPKEPVDAVLIDAPCTATGTIRHQPDVLWLKGPQDQQKLVALQQRLLQNGAKMLKPGGTLIYCSCSIQKAEGEDQAQWLVQHEPSVSLSRLTKEEFPAIADLLTARGDMRCLPFPWQDIGGMDGFYAARFVKN